MSSRVEGKIWFHGNPWPNGHRLAELRWVATIEPGRGLWLGFELETANYYEEDGGPTYELAPEVLARGDDSGWTVKYVWSNYHRGWIAPSNTHDHPGILVADGSAPFSFDAPHYHWRVDPPPIDWETFWETQAFGTYVLGHDACADHDIRLDRAGDGTYDLAWRGRIALAYSGSYELDRTFEVKARGVTLDAIALPADAFGDDGESRVGDSRQSLERVLSGFVERPERFALEYRHGRPFAVPSR